MSRLFVASTLLLASFAANAQYAEIRQGAYAGAGFGTTKIAIDDLGSENFNTYAITAGYHFAQPWSLEVSYVDPEKDTLRVGSALATYDTSGVVTQAVGHLPLGGPAQLIGSLGALWWHQKVSVRTPTTFVSQKDDDVDIIFGAGLGMSFDRVWIRGMYNRAETRDGSIGAWSLNASFHF